MSAGCRDDPLSGLWRSLCRSTWETCSLRKFRECRFPCDFSRQRNLYPFISRSPVDFPFHLDHDDSPNSPSSKTHIQRFSQAFKTQQIFQDWAATVLLLPSARALRFTGQGVLGDILAEQHHDSGRRLGASWSPWTQVQFSYGPSKRRWHTAVLCAEFGEFCGLKLLVAFFGVEDVSIRPN